MQAKTRANLTLSCSLPIRSIPALDLVHDLAQITDKVDPVLPQPFHLLRLPLGTFRPVSRASQESRLEPRADRSSIITIILREPIEPDGQLMTAQTDNGDNDDGSARDKSADSRFNLVADHDHAPT